MGNLGRALFGDSTNRMWPYSYNACEPSVFDPKNQRISACDANPGSGMNPNQGRGAPEIDILEGGGLIISSSLQIAPGMPTDFRRIAGENTGCIYDRSCQTTGANDVGVPTATYEDRGHKNWYQGLRYGFNPFCTKNETQAQTLDAVEASLKAGIKANKCDLKTCPASFDVNSDLSAISGSSSKTITNWGINSDGSCFTQMNTYDGALLCSPGNEDAECKKQAGDSPVPAQAASTAPYKYRLDALSANWPIHLAMYTDFLAYQVEWVPGKNGYIRWMLEKQPIFEIPAEAIMNPPQDSGKTNPAKILPEEPMYLILNVALSSSWSSEPPNAGRACKDHGDITDTNTIGLSNLICDQFPMDMKIDYVRVYQDMSSTSNMNFGCDPATHPTRQWINDHIKEYQNDANPVAEVAGKAYCATDADCGNGNCMAEKRCVCSGGWTGPRCTFSASNSSTPSTGGSKSSGGSTTPGAPTPTSAAGGVFSVTLSVGALVALVFAAEAL